MKKKLTRQYDEKIAYIPVRRRYKKVEKNFFSRIRALTIFYIYPLEKKHKIER